MFGNSGFGSGAGFGQQQQQQPQQSSVFGQPQPQNTGFGGAGGFGATSTPSAFGGTSAFGQTTQTSGFGSAAPVGGGFGATTGTGFGQTPTSAFSFGTSAQQQPAAATATGFGGFGSTNTAATSAFGGSNITGGNTLFGQPTSGFGNASKSTAFGANTGASPFGSGGMFGAGAAAGASNQGSAIADFAPSQERDTGTGVFNYLQTITAMPQYSKSSLEELRLQDYTQNRKSSTAASGGAFGATTTLSTGFGNTTTGFGQSGFGQQQQQQQPSLFGQTTNTGFGTAGSTPFGGQQQQQTPFGGATTGGFGASAAKPFGGQAFSGGNTAFGQQASTTPGFGQPAQQQNTGFGGFGGFGTPSTSTASTQPTNGFGGFGTALQPSATTGFGAGAAGGFGAGQQQQQQQQQQPMGGGFGSGTGMFGGGAGGFGTSTSKPFGSFSFSAPAQQPAATTGFSFGSTNAGTSGFGTNQPAASGTGFGGFGAGQTGTIGSTFGGFGSTQQQQPGNFTTPNTGGLTSFGTNTLLGNQQQQQQQQQPLFATVDKSPFGQNSVYDASKKVGANALPSAIPVESQRKMSSPHFPTSPQVVSKIKLRGFALSPSYTPSTKKLSALETIGDDAILSGDAFSKHPMNKKLIFDKDVSAAEIESLVNKKSSSSQVLFDPKLELVAASKQQQEDGPIENQATEQTPSALSKSGDLSAIMSTPAFTLTAEKEGYYSSPSYNELAAMAKEELQHVSNFTVGRTGYGEVQFAVPVDLSQVELSSIMGGLVIIRERQIVVYPKQETKPEEGSGLNVPAIARLENCFPFDKDTKQPIRDPEHPRFRLFAKKLRTRSMAEFVDYNENTGTWTFKVKHF
ncbi:nucleoporin autopeptidase-domain-containing protein [Dichotomocladium elegans]|nr:nucleoporin autopeptidase-domain-containing protein [Dichotomocladium elegans]